MTFKSRPYIGKYQSRKLNSKSCSNTSNGHSALHAMKDEGKSIKGCHFMILMSFFVCFFADTRQQLETHIFLPVRFLIYPLIIYNFSSEGE